METGIMVVILGLYGDDGKEQGNYSNGLHRVLRLGFRAGLGVGV